MHTHPHNRQLNRAVTNGSSEPIVQVIKDIPYREAEGYDPLLNTLDIYYSSLAPREPKRTIVVFIHGGSWCAGDKRCFPEPLERSMPAWFVRGGYVFAAINFRLAGSRSSPNAGVADIAFDVGKALKWLTVNGRRFGGRPSGLVLVGYSSGGHLAALVATHEHFLRACRLSAADLSGVIVLDVPYFDVPLAMRMLEVQNVRMPSQVLRRAGLYRLFGALRSEQEKLSPAAELGPWLSRTAFLLVSTGIRFGQPQTITRQMSELFRECLAAHGIRSEHLHLDNWEHADLITRWGGELATRIGQFLEVVGPNHSLRHE